MINPVECLAKVNKTSQDSSRLLVASVNISLDEVEHENKVMLYRAARKSTKLIKVNMVLNIGPDPFDEKPFQALADEGCEAKVSKFILRLRLGNLVNREMVFLLVRLWPAVSCNSLTVDSSYRGSKLREKFI